MAFSYDGYCKHVSCIHSCFGTWESIWKLPHKESNNLQKEFHHCQHSKQVAIQRYWFCATCYSTWIMVCVFLSLHVYAIKFYIIPAPAYCLLAADHTPSGTSNPRHCSLCIGHVTFHDSSYPRSLQLYHLHCSKILLQQKIKQPLSHLHMLWVFMMPWMNDNWLKNGKSSLTTW